MIAKLIFPFVGRSPAYLAALAAVVVPTTALAGPSAKNPKAPINPGYELPSGRGRFYMSAGWMWKETGGAHFDTGSRSRDVRLPRFVGEAGAMLPGIGPVGGYGDRFYRDGFVKVDGGTAFDGTTSAWAYQDASQVSGDSLYYHATGHRSTSSSGQSLQAPRDFSDDGSGSAPFIELGWERELTEAVSLGVRFQWSFLDFDGAGSQSDFSAWQKGQEYSIAYTDRYDLQGVIPPLAPYEGAGLGFGPLIDNLPASRQGGESAAGGSRARFFNRVEQSFDVKLHTLSLGPVVSGGAGRIRFQGGAGLALNLVDWEAEQVETLFVSRGEAGPRVYRRWTDRRQDVEVLPGFYLQGGVSWQVTPGVFVSGFGRYDWSGKLEQQLGPSTFTFDPGGWSVGASVGIAF